MLGLMVLIVFLAVCFGKLSFWWMVPALLAFFFLGGAE
jgi:hypothetical protein